MTQVTTTAGGTTMSFPNTCNTPAAPSPVPIPYPSIADCSTADSSTCSQKVKILNKPILIETSVVKKTSGDEAGTNGGVTSGTFGDECGRTQASSKVNIEGTPLVTNLQTVGSNGASPNAPVGTQLEASQTTVTCLS